MSASRRSMFPSMNFMYSLRAATLSATPSTCFSAFFSEARYSSICSETFLNSSASHSLRTLSTIFPPFSLSSFCASSSVRTMRLYLYAAPALPQIVCTSTCIITSEGA